MDTTLNMTKYFRDSNAAKTSIDLTNLRPIYTSLRTVEEGWAEDVWYHYLSDGKESKPIEIIIVVKTVLPSFKAQEKVNVKDNDLEGMFFIPAVLNKSGELKKTENKVPWIARDYLNPIVDADMAVGDLEDFDSFMEENYKRFLDLEDWNEYITFSKEMFEHVTNQVIETEQINDITFDGNVYVLKDKMVNASRKILELYDHLLEGGWKKSSLYQTFMDSTQQPTLDIIPNTSSISKEHIGQMNGEYPLSPSQRESINHFNHMKAGEVLAVNGPPGTGKTTLLQSVVANLFVKHAINEYCAPRIVGASTNNRAVKNIVDSFGSVKKQKEDSNLEERWVENVHSFAVYFPSGTKKNQAIKNGYQVTSPNGEGFFEDIEEEENMEKSKEKMLSNCRAYFQKSFSTIEACKNKLHQHLKIIVQFQKNLLHLMEKWEQLTKELHLGANPVDEAQKNLDDSKEVNNQLKQRYSEWEEYYRSLPFYYRWFSFLPPVHKKIQQKMNVNLHVNEDNLEDKSCASILGIYSEEISLARKTVVKKQKNLEKLQELRNNMWNEKTQLEGFLQRDLPEEMIYSLDDLNKHLDTCVRYKAFWFAVHYYECRWLEAKRLTEKQQRRNFKNVLNHRYDNLSMIAPCYVMTFYKLPDLSYAYDNGVNHFLYNSIDLLIVDEGGQVTPEIAACSFSLANRAIVVGDTKQIEPIWNITESLDYSMALGAGAASDHKSFEQLKEAGLYTAGSNVMQVASKSCQYQKYDQRGLFLSEHRRCYDEIISYCNQLVYKNKLEPMRGSGRAHASCYPLRSLNIPHFGLKQINSEASSRNGGSRMNTKEAHVIADWLHTNFDTIAQAYPDNNSNEVIGIITPFKRQTECIQRKLPSHIRKNVHVGTVHTFQGGELPVIILSTVYGKSDNGAFIDRQSNLLNVAVSRSKDSFLVFGDKRFMSDSNSTPSGLLKEMVKEF